MVQRVAAGLLARCPHEYQQKVDAWMTLLEPFVKE